MDQIDRKLLAALLARAGSEHDGEVLVFVRKADALVKAAGMTWSDVLASDGPSSPGVRDQAVTAPGGHSLRPPVGGTWIETVHTLIVACPPFVTEYQARWLMDLLASLKRGNRLPTVSEASGVVTIYEMWATAEPER